MKGYEALSLLTIHFPDELDRAREQNDETLEAKWWSDRDIDVAGVARWSLEQAAEDLGHMLELFGPRLAPEQLGAVLSTAYHLGILMGVRLQALDLERDPSENAAYGPGNPDWERDFEKTREP